MDRYWPAGRRFDTLFLQACEYLINDSNYSCCLAIYWSVWDDSISLLWTTVSLDKYWVDDVSEKEETIHCPWMCTALPMSKNIRRPGRASEKKKKKKTPSSSVPSRPELGRSSFTLVRMFQAQSDFFQLHLRSHPSSKIGPPAWISLWSGWLRPACYWLAAYSTAAPVGVSELSSSPLIPASYRWWKGSLLISALVVQYTAAGVNVPRCFLLLKGGLTKSSGAWKCHWARNGSHAAFDAVSIFDRRRTALTGRRSSSARRRRCLWPLFFFRRF